VNFSNYRQFSFLERPPIALEVSDIDNDTLEPNAGQGEPVVLFKTYTIERD
jgi:hypothetical protein